MLFCSGRCIQCTVYFRLILILGFLFSWLLLVQFWNQTAQPLLAQLSPDPNPPANQCRTCHQGIEPIRDYQSKMMKEILKVAALAGYPGNDCIVCHGGQPNGKNFAAIHSGTVDYFRTHPGPKDFYPDPGSPWINVHTCGPCHRELVRTQWTSLMMTEAGKIQGVLWGFGALSGYDHQYANYAVHTLPDSLKLGTPIYKTYMQRLAHAEPQVFKDSMSAVPPAPHPNQIRHNPQLAAFTYIRGECQRCHLAVQGRHVRGDFRGMGCSACHIPYSNEGYYEGNDPTIPRNEPGHPLVHSIQATREAQVRVHNKQYSGIPIETCTTCHNRGRRIGVSYQGLMETCFQSPFMGVPHKPEPPPLHTKHYLHLMPDVHLRKGMLCQDCHTSLDVHSDGTLVGTTQAAVEIECTDCHGTPDYYPWELPLGYGDEIAGPVPATGPPRGTTDTLPNWLKKGTVYPPEDGYLLTARGNPLGNVVRRGNLVIVHTAGGKDLLLKPLKLLTQENQLNRAALTAMAHAKHHIDKMECYACHATWAPQCYGCHIRIDYSKGRQLIDWVAIGHAPDQQGLTPDARHLIDSSFYIWGEVHEERSYLRWEDPPLGINGEHRVSPLTTGCQTTVTIIDDSGKTLLLNHIFKITGVHGFEASDTVLALDMVPLHPHTVQKEARTCESCHNNPKALGMGIAHGKLYWQPDSPYIVDLTTANGTVLPEHHQVQVPAIPNLPYDWSRFLDEQLRQIHTVGHHLSGSRAFTPEEIQHIYREGVCLSCHDAIPDGNVAINLMVHLRQIARIQVDASTHDRILNKLLKLSAWTQILLLTFGTLALFALLGFTLLRLLTRKKKQAHLPFQSRR